MKKIKVLHIGIKNWPYDSAFLINELVGIRGGGMNKYCDTLLNTLPGNIETYIITQKLKGQSRYEEIKNIRVFRKKTFGKRAFRQIFVNILSFFYAFKIINKYKIDLIHGHMIHGVLVALFLGKIFNKKIIGTPYSISTKYDDSSFNKLAKLFDGYFYKRLDTIVFETEENRKKITELRNLIFKNSIVINTGINLPNINKAEKFFNGKIKILYIGRIIKIKAIDKLILSLQYMEDKILSKIHIDIIGEGELLKHHKCLIEKNNLSDYISLHGFVFDTVSYFKAADIFILPSYMEGLSISLLEAMSYGKACIVNDFGIPFSNSEIFVMKNNNPSTIAQSITHFVNNKNLIQKLGRNARNIIEEKFSVKTFANKYAEVYKNLKGLSNN